MPAQTMTPELEKDLRLLKVRLPLIYQPLYSSVFYSTYFGLLYRNWYLSLCIERCNRAKFFCKREMGSTCMFFEYLWLQIFMNLYSPRWLELVLRIYIIVR